MTWEQQAAGTDDNLQSYLKMCTLIGYPVQITFKDARSSTAVARVSGILQQVGETGFMVDLEFPISMTISGILAHFQIISKLALVEFQTSMHHADSPSRLYFEIPTYMEYIQRRSHVRANVQLDARFTGGESDTPMPIKIINISVGGAACLSDLPQAVGVTLTLHLDHLGLIPPEVTSRVVRCTPADSGLWMMGVRFEALSAGQESAVSQYVATMLSQPDQS